MDVPSPSIWQNNLAVLRKAYPDLAKDVEQASTEHILLEPRSAAQFPACRLTDSSGQRRGRDGWIHGPDDPVDEANEILRSVVGRETDLLLLIQSGLGHVLHAVCRHFTRLMLQRGREPLLIVIEEDLGLFRMCLQLRPWQNILSSQRVLLYLGRPLEETVQGLAEKYPEMFLKRRLVFCPGCHLSREEIDRLNEAGQHIRTLAASEEQRLAKRYSAQIEYRSADHPKPRVLLFSHYFPTIQTQVRKAFRQIGWDCRLLSWPREEQFIKNWAWLDILETFEPDLLVFLNETPEEIAESPEFGQLPIPKIVWFFDDPLRFIPYPPRPLRRNEKDIVLGFDPGHMRILSLLGFRKSHLLRPGTGFTPPAVEERESGRYTERITYVGNLPAEGVRFLENGLLKPIRPDLLPVIDKGVDYLLANPRGRLYEWLEVYMPRDCGIHQRHLYVTIQDKATWRGRRAFLEPLADCGLDLYGPNSWSEPNVAGRLVDCYSGRMVDYETELPGIYASSAINVNLTHAQFGESTDPRIYDVLGCGGFLVTDDNPGIHDEFTDGEHLVVARTPEEMREKALHYLERPEERHRIAENGRRLVVERYTYRHRLSQLLRIAALDTVQD